MKVVNFNLVAIAILLLTCRQKEEFNIEFIEINDTLTKYIKYKGDNLKVYGYLNSQDLHDSIKSIYLNDTLIQEVSYSNGSITGWTTWYWKNGNLKEKAY